MGTLCHWRAQKDVDKRIEDAYLDTCRHLAVPVTAIPKVFREGRRCIAEGKTDEELRTIIIRIVNAFLE